MIDGGRSRFFRPIRLIAVIVMASFAVSCDILPALFNEYEGVNFLSGYAFDSPEWQADQNSPYMRFEQVSGAIALEVGIPEGFSPEDPSTAIYRLEISNLVPNGDFEDTTVTVPDGWSSTDAGLPGSVVLEVQTDATVEGNRELAISLEAEDEIVFDLSDTAGGSLDGLIVDAFYGIRFDFDPSEALDYRFQYDDTIDDTTDIPRWEAQVLDPTVDYAFPVDFADVTSEFAVSAEQNTLVIAGLGQTLDIDNFRLVRTDIPLSVRIHLPFSSDGRPDLISGWYTFGCFVRVDPTAGRLTDSRYLNRFAAKAVTFGIGTVESVARYDAAAETIASDSPVFGPDAWYWVEQEVFLQIDPPPEDPDTDVISLSLSPADIITANSLDAGSILLTAPSLTYSKNRSN